MQFSREVFRKFQKLDELDGVSQVLLSAGIRHSGSELQLDERREIQASDSATGLRHPRRIGEGDGLRLSVAGKLPRDEELDSHSELGVSQILGSRERWQVSPSLELLVDRLEVALGHEDVDVLGEPAV